MTEEQNETAFRRLIEEAFNRGRVDVVDQIFAPHFVEHQDGILPPTTRGVKASIVSLRTAFPDLTLAVEDLIARDDRVWARLTGSGTHRSPFAGLPPTGKLVRATFVDICRFEDGRIVEHWGVPDLFSTLAQLCAVPQPPRHKA